MKSSKVRKTKIREKIDKVNDAQLENVKKWACYNAYVLYKAKDCLVNKLKDTNMYKLYSILSNM